ANGWLAPLEGDLEVDTSKLLQPTVESATYNDKLYALPQNTNAQLLYRNTDIIKDVPENWDALVEKCKEVKHQDCLTATLTQYEGSTIITDGIMHVRREAILDEDGNVTVTDEKFQESPRADVAACEDISYTTAGTGPSQQEVNLSFTHGQIALA